MKRSAGDELNESNAKKKLKVEADSSDMGKRHSFSHGARVLEHEVSCPLQSTAVSESVADTTEKSVDRGKSYQGIAKVETKSLMSDALSTSETFVLPSIPTLVNGTMIYKLQERLQTTSDPDEKAIVVHVTHKCRSQHFYLKMGKTST